MADRDNGERGVSEQASTTAQSASDGAGLTRSGARAVRKAAKSDTRHAVAGEPILTVTDLKKHFPGQGSLFTKGAPIRAVDGVTFEVLRGETFSIVGESGCGKTTTGRMVTRLIEPTSGQIIFDGRDITHASTRTLRPMRREMQMIFQDPYGSLNPRHTVGTIIGAPFAIQGIKTEGGRKRAVQDLLKLVGLSPEHYNRYPHEFSGGQRQRIGVARALALRPKLIVADEPVSALDVSIQAQVVNLLEDLQDELGLTYVTIAHDLSVVRSPSVSGSGSCCRVTCRARCIHRRDAGSTRAARSRRRFVRRWLLPSTIWAMATKWHVTSRPSRPERALRSSTSNRPADDHRAGGSWPPAW